MTRRVAYYYVTKGGCPCRVTRTLHKDGIAIPAYLRIDEGAFTWGAVEILQVIPGKRSRKQAYRLCESLIERSGEFRSRNKNAVAVDDYDLLYQSLSAGSFEIRAVYINVPSARQ
jgi:hypothetical protein